MLKAQGDDIVVARAATMEFNRINLDIKNNCKVGLGQLMIISGSGFPVEILGTYQMI